MLAIWCRLAPSKIFIATHYTTLHFQYSRLPWVKSTLSVLQGVPGSLTTLSGGAAWYYKNTQYAALWFQLIIVKEFLLTGSINVFFLNIYIFSVAWKAMPHSHKTNFVCAKSNHMFANGSYACPVWDIELKFSELMENVSYQSVT